MKPERTFVAESAAAQHCPELLRGAEPSTEALLPRLAALGEPLARALAAALAPLCGNEPPEVCCGEVRQASPAELATEIAPLAANSLLAAGAPDATLLMSIEAKAVLRLIDRAFGGRGHVPEQLPEAFPLSAELLIAKLEALVCGALGKALGGVARLDAMRRDCNLDRLAPFAEGTDLAVLAIAITETNGASWQMHLAIPDATLPVLLSGRGAAVAPATGDQGTRDPLAEPYSAVPLALSAVLVDMHVPVSALSSLAPGQVIPVAVARSVPLRIGGRTIAHGTVGTLDDRVAVQITQAF